MVYAIILPLLFAIYAVIKKKVTASAGVAAYIMGSIITYFGGIYAFIALALTFILTTITDKLNHKVNREVRTIYQMFSNILTSTVCIILYAMKNNDIFFIMYFCTIATSLSDTLASSIGSLSKKRPVHPITFKKLKKGESGAVSLLGIESSIFGGIIIGLVYYALTYDAQNYILIILMATIGSYIDSLLGILVQGKYICNVCNNQVENKIHCNKETKLIKGYSFVNNNMVNLLNNISVFIISYLILK